MIDTYFYRCTKRPLKVIVRKLARFTPKDIVLETFLKSPLRMRFESATYFSDVKPQVNFSLGILRRRLKLKLKGRLERLKQEKKDVDLKVIRNRNLRGFYSFNCFRNCNLKVPSTKVYFKGASIAGLKTQEALVRGYLHSILRSTLKFDKDLIKLHYEAYSQI